MKFITVKCDDGTIFNIPCESVDFILTRNDGNTEVWLKDGHSVLVTIDKVTEITYD